MSNERVLIPGDEQNENLDSDQILVFDNQGDGRKITTLVEAREKSEAISKLGVIAAALKDLPIDSLSYEANPATGELGWHAPKGYSFKIEGKFNISQTELIVEGGGSFAPPIRSRSQFIEDNIEEYKNFLEIAKGDEKRALRLLINDYKDWNGEGSVGFLPTNFIGKWLFIESKEGKPISLQEVSDDIRFKVAMDAEVWENEDFNEEWQFKLESQNAITRTVFPSNARIDYVQSYAEALSGDCQITLIKRREKKLGLLIAKPRSISIVKPLRSVIELQESKEKSKPGDVRF